MSAGYSATPLPRKLGIGEGSSFALVDAPGGRVAGLGPLPEGAHEAPDVTTADVVLAFFTAREALEQRLATLAHAIHPDRVLWVAWPKRASRIPTDMREDVVREVALPLGLVDTKVAAIDETWSGLKLVWRRERRGA